MKTRSHITLVSGKRQRAAALQDAGAISGLIRGRGHVLRPALWRFFSKCRNASIHGPAEKSKVSVSFIHNQAIQPLF
jgi:hypothetical protein